MPFLYDTHIHTSQASKCGGSTGAEHARAYKELGFQGIIITDHFFGGNTAVPRDLPWKERVDIFCSGYEDALIEGQKIGLDVFFGWEQNFMHDEYLIYGLDKRWLLDHPEMEHWTRAQQLSEVHKYGGCVVQAHPFRDRNYIDHIRLGLLYCDAVEVLNMGNQPYNDAAAYRYAKEYGLPMTAGSDNHHADYSLADPAERICSIQLPRRMDSIQDYVRLIRQKEEIPFFVPNGRFDVTPDAPQLESFWLDENEQRQPTGRDWLQK